MKSNEKPGLQQALEALDRSQAAKSAQQQLAPAVERAAARQQWHQERNHFAQALADALSVRHGGGGQA